MLWSKDILTWNDFKAKPDNVGQEAAMTASAIETNMTHQNYLVNMTIETKFYPYASWSLKNKQNDYILKHEQLHFDITELYSRMLKKELLDNLKYKKDITKYQPIAQKDMKAWDEAQRLYDKETNHSINESAQEKWNEYIAAELEKYADYRQAKYTFKLK
jgi:hypothetical protein